MSLVWYFAMATVLSNGDVLVDAMRTADKAQCYEEVARLQTSPLDVAHSFALNYAPRSWWRRLWQPLIPLLTVRTPYTLVAPCAQFSSHPTVIVAGDRRSIRMTP